MAHFVVLGKWTAQGAASYKDSVKRADAAAELMAKMGGRMVDIYWTLGKYDFVVIAEMPDDESATVVMLKSGAQGNISTATMRAFNRDEMAAIIAKAGG